MALIQRLKCHEIAFKQFFGKLIVTENAFPTPPLEQGSVFCHNPGSLHFLDDHDCATFGVHPIMPVLEWK